MNIHILDEARKLSVADQLELVETLWDEIVGKNALPPVTESQKTELERRLADYEARPDDVIPWDDVKSAAKDRLR